MKRKILILIAALLTMVFFIAGCNLVEKQEKIGKIIDGREVIATVNGTHVLKSDYDSQVKATEKAIKSYYGEEALDTDAGKATFENVKKQILEQMINDELIKQNAKALKVNIEQTEVTDQMTELINQFGGEENLEKLLEQQGTTKDDLKKSIEMEILRYKLMDEVGKDIQVSDDEIKTYYETNKNDFKEQPDQVKARHILVDTEKEALNLKKQIEEGADFAELAKKHSKDTASAENGGDLGHFMRGQMVPEFENAAFSLNAGEVSEPVKTQFGYHIIKVEEKNIYPVFDLSEVKDSIREMLLHDKKTQTFNAELEAWGKKADIKQYL